MRSPAYTERAIELILDYTYTLSFVLCIKFSNLEGGEWGAETELET